MRRSRSRRRRRVIAAAAAAIIVAAGGSLVQATDEWTIQLGVRETGTSPGIPIGNNGGTTGDIEWITSTSPTITTADGWKQFTWNFGSDPVTAFTGDGVLSAANNRGVLEHIRI